MRYGYNIHVCIIYTIIYIILLLYILHYAVSCNIIYNTFLYYFRIWSLMARKRTISVRSGEGQNYDILFSLYVYTCITILYTIHCLYLLYTLTYRIHILLLYIHILYRDADRALKIVDGDLDGKIGLVDFIRFATRLKTYYYSHLDGGNEGVEEEEGEMSG